MSPKELKTRLDARKSGNDDFYLLDVRNPNEQEICLIEGTDLLIPVTDLPAHVAELEPWKQSGKDIIVYCRSGGRSGSACVFLKSAGYAKVFNLEGGILRYSDDVDSSLAKY
ncbi:rhodanese-like protein [Leptospira broomii serovar Hurstbridge str. 5399]|uniref:Rhodanese-like protein n=1 Tax=Leptospira broomii serovar Hurstbridge str. 5399 TaxID=1049789 RepID=T0FEF0_9LEPT|nr:rhodanese-like domain-containing protein [Leptospira broomii]EQA45982.1 rhodanese-like protein [Leptospira broomii serovar Hurstbridge str. 5399]